MKAPVAAATLLALAGTLNGAMAGDVWRITPPHTLQVTSGTMGEFHATITPDDWDQFNIPSGTYHGLRLSFDWQRLDGTAIPFDTAFSFFDPSQPVVPQNRIGPYVRSSPLVNPGSDPLRITYDEPTFWVRSFYSEPGPIPGGRPLGARFNVWTRWSTVQWSNIEIELYEATMTVVEGDSFSAGMWFRPMVDPWLGIDQGRSDTATGYNVYPFTVDASGTYGIHTHFEGADYPDGRTYLFADEFDLDGEYDHLLDANWQGDFGLGYPDIKSVSLEVGRTYYLVQSAEFPQDQYTFRSWIAGPGNVHVIPEPATLVLLGLAGLAVWRRR